MARKLSIMLLSFVFTFALIASPYSLSFSSGFPDLKENKAHAAGQAGALTLEGAAAVVAVLGTAFGIDVTGTNGDVLAWVQNDFDSFMSDYHSMSGDIADSHIQTQRNVLNAVIDSGYLDLQDMYSSGLYEVLRAYALQLPVPSESGATVNPEFFGGLSFALAFSDEATPPPWIIRQTAYGCFPTNYYWVLGASGSLGTVTKGDVCYAAGGLEITRYSGSIELSYTDTSFYVSGLLHYRFLSDYTAVASGFDAATYRSASTLYLNSNLNYVFKYNSQPVFYVNEGAVSQVQDGSVVTDNPDVNLGREFWAGVTSDMVDVLNKGLAVPVGADAVYNPDGTVADAGSMAIPQTGVGASDWADALNDAKVGVATGVDGIAGVTAGTAAVAGTATGVITDTISSLTKADTPNSVKKNPNWKRLRGKLAKVFPFCLIADLALIYGKLDAEPQTPVVDFPVSNILPSVNGGENTVIHIDLHDWDGLAAVVRTMWLLFFTVALVFLTLKFIRPDKGSGGN